MKKIYLVKYSTGQYDDYRVNNLESCFISLSAAEKAKEELEQSMITSPFPFDWCDEYNIDDDELSLEQVDVYNDWCVKNYVCSDFNSAWIETLNLIE